MCSPGEECCSSAKLCSTSEDSIVCIRELIIIYLCMQKLLFLIYHFAKVAAYLTFFVVFNGQWIFIMCSMHTCHQSLSPVSEKDRHLINYPRMEGIPPPQKKVTSHLISHCIFHSISHFNLFSFVESIESMLWALSSLIGLERGLSIGLEKSVTGLERAAN